MASTINLLGNSGLAVPRSGYAKRMKRYLAEMYPVPTRLTLATLTYFSTVAFLGRVHGTSNFTSPYYAFVGITSLFSLMLIIRLMDELKDKEIDRALFPHRPLPSGRIFETDIIATMVVSGCIYLLANIMAGRVFWIALFVLAYACLMFKHFFIPEILRKSLLLTVATHNPLVAFMLLYVSALFFSTAAIPLETIDWHATLLVILMNWATCLAWELARKIRCREEENTYETYSQIFGRLGAVGIALGTQTVTFSIGLYFAWILSLSPLFVVLWSAAYAVPVAALIRFLHEPTPVTSRLGPYAEVYMLAILAVEAVENLFLP